MPVTYTITRRDSRSLTTAGGSVSFTVSVGGGGGGGSVSWPVYAVSATHSVYLVPTTLTNDNGAGSEPQYAYLDYGGAEPGSARFGVGYLYRNLFGEKSGDVRLNDLDGFFAGVCGGTATARFETPEHGARTEIEANTVEVMGQGFVVNVNGYPIAWPLFDAAGAMVSDGDGNLSFVATPTDPGTYVLTATVGGGLTAFSWEVAGTSPPPPPGSAMLDFSEASNSMYLGSLV